MWCQFSLRSEEFLAHYHRRSNVESARWMIKEQVRRGRTFQAARGAGQRIALLCHNLTCIVHAIAEFGIEPAFASRAEAA
jgi:hypothetical protein